MKKALKDYIEKQIDKVLDLGDEGKPDVQAFNKIRKNFPGGAGDFILMGMICKRAIERSKKGNGNGKK
tara:strand:+ start:25 stop:228 length:204 start_codon:yes stop_codon:yes gene_type:complete